MSRPRAACVLLCIALGISGCGSSTRPAATVNGHEISMSAFDNQVHYSREIQRQNGFDPCAQPGTKVICKQTKKSALDSLIQNEIIREYAAKHHIVVSNADFNRQWTQIFKGKFSGDKRQLNAFAAGLHITVAEVKQRVRSDQLRQRVEVAVTGTVPTAAPAVRLAHLETLHKAEAENIKTQLQHGTPLKTVLTRLVAEKQSLCRTGCGELGWIPEALIPGYEKKILTGAAGSISGRCPCSRDINSTPLRAAMVGITLPPSSK